MNQTKQKERTKKYAKYLSLNNQHVILEYIWFSGPFIYKRRLRVKIYDWMSILIIPAWSYRNKSLQKMVWNASKNNNTKFVLHSPCTIVFCFFKVWYMLPGSPLLTTKLYLRYDMVNENARLLAYQGMLWCYLFMLTLMISNLNVIT